MDLHTFKGRLYVANEQYQWIDVTDQKLFKVYDEVLTQEKRIRNYPCDLKEVDRVTFATYGK